MIYTDRTKRAIRLMFQAHREQTDKSGLPYVFHPFHLAEQMDDEASVVTALLHDVAEDSPWTLEQIAAMGFPPEVMQALRLLTHDDDSDYFSYVRRIRANPLARKVKLADLRHNSDLTRLDTVDAEAVSRVEKYTAAIRILQDD